MAYHCEACKDKGMVGRGGCPFCKKKKAVGPVEDVDFIKNSRGERHWLRNEFKPKPNHTIMGEAEKAQRALLKDEAGRRARMWNGLHRSRASGTGMAEWDKVLFEEFGDWKDESLAMIDWKKYAKEYLN